MRDNFVEGFYATDDAERVLAWLREQQAKMEGSKAISRRGRRAR